MNEYSYEYNDLINSLRADVGKTSNCGIFTTNLGKIAGSDHFKWHTKLL